MSHAVIPWIVAIGLFMENLDSTIVSTAIPQMAITFQVSPISLKVALTSYLLSLAIFIPISGWLADKFGTRKIFSLALLIFTVSSLLCAVSHNLAELVIARIIQGFGGALMTPVGRLILLKTFSKTELLKVNNFIGIPSVMGAVLGPVVGGVIATYFSWHWIFYINLPVGLLGLFLTWKFAIDYKAPHVKSFDVTGFLLVGLGLSAFSYGLETVGENFLPSFIAVAIMLASFISLLSYFIYYQHAKNPVLDLKLLRVRTFRIVMMGGSVVRIGFGGIIFLLPFLFQVGFQFSPLRSGLLLLPWALGQLLMKFFNRQIIQFLGFRKSLVLGAILMGICVMQFAFFEKNTSYFLISGMIFLYGLMLSLHYSSTGVLTYIDLESTDLSKGTSIASVNFQLSASFGIALTAFVLKMFMGSSSLLLANAVSAAQDTFLVMGIIIAFSSVFFWQLKEGDGGIASGHT
jgi:EmrB/QacA subfamily drug resistance transporter